MWSEFLNFIDSQILKFIHSEKATKFCEIFPLLLTTQYIQSKVRGRFRKILWPSQNIWTLGKICMYYVWVNLSVKEISKGMLFIISLVCTKKLLKFQVLNHLTWLLKSLSISLAFIVASQTLNSTIGITLHQSSAPFALHMNNSSLRIISW